MVHLKHFNDFNDEENASHHNKGVSNTIQYNDSVESIPLFPEHKAFNLLLEDQILLANNSCCPGVEGNSEDEDRQVHLAQQSIFIKSFLSSGLTT